MMYLIHFAKELLTSNNFATGLPCEPYRNPFTNFT